MLQIYDKCKNTLYVTFSSLLQTAAPLVVYLRFVFKYVVRQTFYVLLMYTNGDCTTLTIGEIKRPTEVINVSGLISTNSLLYSPQ